MALRLREQLAEIGRASQGQEAEFPRPLEVRDLHLALQQIRYTPDRPVDLHDKYDGYFQPPQTRNFLLVPDVTVLKITDLSRLGNGKIFRFRLVDLEKPKRAFLQGDTSDHGTNEKNWDNIPDEQLLPGMTCDQIRFLREHLLQSHVFGRLVPVKPEIADRYQRLAGPHNPNGLPPSAA
jgi:hypothetical protein